LTIQKRTRIVTFLVFTYIFIGHTVGEEFVLHRALSVTTILVGSHFDPEKSE